ncbi:hypothetical protein [Streptomyces sp. NPDC050738]|uniref:hypothetical protein n=1 Tax=Streptomyces sp. NPDC050738 TaxID=3154744 RepID=UPI0034172B8D
MWPVLTVGSLAMVGMKSQDTYGSKQNPVATLWVLAFLVLLFFVGASYGSLRRLHKIRKVLRSYRWEYREGVRRTQGAKEAMGVAVQLRSADDDAGWTRGMVARNPLKWNRWTPELEHGAWFAGDLPFGGVIALPGGNALMLLSIRYRLSMEQRVDLARDRDRMALAKTGGISGNVSDGYR